MTLLRHALAWIPVLCLAWPASLCLADAVEEEYDDDGRMVRSVDDEGRVTRYSYDADGAVKVDVDRSDATADLYDTGFTRSTSDSRAAGSTQR